METVVGVAQSDAWGHSIPFHQNDPPLRTRHPHYTLLRTNHVQVRLRTSHIRLHCVRVFSDSESASFPEKDLFLYPLASALP